MQNQDGQKKIIVGLVVLVIIAAVVYASISLSAPASTTTSQSDASTAPVTAQTSTNSSAASIASTANQTYKDGTYTATGNYRIPGGTESIAVSVTIKNSVIIDSTTTGNARNRDSAAYQAMFIDGYKSEVVGKNVNQVSLTAISGASLTPIGFNNALATIKAQAKS